MIHMEGKKMECERGKTSDNGRSKLWVCTANWKAKTCDSVLIFHKGWSQCQRGTFMHVWNKAKKHPNYVHAFTHLVNLSVSLSSFTLPSHCKKIKNKEKEREKFFPTTPREFGFSVGTRRREILTLILIYLWLIWEN